MDLAESTKVCTGCYAEQPLEAYVKAPRGKLGRDSRCKSCKSAYRRANREHAAAYHRAYREANRDRIAAYRQANRDKRRAQWEAWAELNAGQIAERRRGTRDRDAETERRWRAANPERVRAYHARRRALKAYAAAEVGPVDTDTLWQHYGGNCPLCFTKIDRSLSYPDPLSASLDHAVPLSKGGTHTQDNLQWTHLTCNVRKGNRD